MKTWLKVTLWVILGWFLLASGLWLLAIPVLAYKWYRGDERARAVEARARAPPPPPPEEQYSEDDVLAAGLVGYWIGHHK